MNQYDGIGGLSRHRMQDGGIIDLVRLNSINDGTPTVNNVSQIIFNPQLFRQTPQLSDISR